jgi:hypothetical protein
MTIRYGASTSLTKEGSLGNIPEEWRETPPEGFAGTLMTQVRPRLMRIAQHYHEQIAEQRLATSANFGPEKPMINEVLGKREPKIPVAEVRARKAREFQKELAAARQQWNAVGAAAVDFEITQTEIPYSKDPANIGLRAEMRSVLRSADDKKKREYLADDAFREAALEATAPLSGMSPLAHEQLRKEYVNSKFPDVVKTVDKWKLAHEIVGQAFKTVSAQIENELTALGEQWVEAQPTTKQRVVWK